MQCTYFFNMILKGDANHITFLIVLIINTCFVISIEMVTSFPYIQFCLGILQWCDKISTQQKKETKSWLQKFGIIPWLWSPFQDIILKKRDYAVRATNEEKIKGCEIVFSKFVNSEILLWKRGKTSKFPTIRTYMWEIKFLLFANVSSHTFKVE